MTIKSEAPESYESESSSALLPTKQETKMGDAPLLTPEEPVLRIGTPSTPTLTPFKEGAIKRSATDSQNNCLESGRCDTDGRLSEICDVEKHVPLEDGI
uniref:Uncharacterized protein n=1 Tax=Timema genevievae TaxID=629358 RepID=A0A7R9PND6_TIMGE|nr:unnamed protein product [Timema genevievae]